jgi:hypothetical protein
VCVTRGERREGRREKRKRPYNVKNGEREKQKGKIKMNK